MAEINQFLSSDAEKQVKDLVKLMGSLAKSYESAFNSSKKLDDQIKKLSKSTDDNNKKKEQLTALQKEESRILKTTETTKAKLQTIATASNKLLVKEQELLKKKNKELRAEATETGKLEGAFRKLNNRRSEAAKRLKDLIASERASTKEIKKAQRAFDQLDKKVQKANRSARQFQSNVGNYPKLFGASTRALGGFLSAFGVVGGIALFARAITAAFKTVREFDKQIIAVQKTTNLSNDEIKLFKTEVIDLGRALKGISIQGLLKASEVAGQLGIKGRKNILKFSKVIEQLKLTSDIAGEEAVRSFAKFIEISVDTVENADRLGSVITELGNNFATSESQILKNTIEIQKGLAIYDASAQGVLALGAATNALGSEAEASRGALQQTFKVLNDGAVQGKNLEKILRLTGQTAAEFKEEFGSDAVRTFQRFINGLGDSAKNGENLSKTLSGLGLDAKRTEAVVGILAKNTNVLNDALERSNKEYKENTALIKEAGLSAKSLDSIIGDLDDAWDSFVLAFDDGSGVLAVAFRSIVEALAFDLNWLADAISGVDKEFRDWKKTVEGFNLSDELLAQNISKFSKELDILRFRANFAGVSLRELDKLTKEQKFAIPKTREERDEAKILADRLRLRLDFLLQIQKDRDIAAQIELDRLAALEAEKERLRKLALATELQKRKDANKKLLNDKMLLQLQQEALDRKESEDLDNRIDNELQAEKDLNAEISKITQQALDDDLQAKKDHEKEIDAINDEAFDKLMKKQQDQEDARREIIQASVDLIAEIFTGFQDLRIQQLSDESNALELQRQTQLENAAGDKAKEAQINAQFDRKQAAIKQQQWKAEQNAALTQILIQGAKGAATTIGNVGLPAAIPLLAILAGLVIAQGAFVKAQKPPKFAKGSKGLQKDTHGIVADAGRELLFMPGGGVALAQKETEGVWPKGTVIKTNKETEQILAANQLRASRENDVMARNYSELRMLGDSLVKDRKSILKAVSERDQYLFEVSKQGVINLSKRNKSGVTTYLNNRFR